MCVSGVCVKGEMYMYVCVCVYLSRETGMYVCRVYECGGRVKLSSSLNNSSKDIVDMSIEVRDVS